jgi:hypothetical protein
MCWILPEVLVGLRNSPSTFRRNLSIDRGKKGEAREFYFWLLHSRGISQYTESMRMPNDHGHFPGKLP